VLEAWKSATGAAVTVHDAARVHGLSFRSLAVIGMIAHTHAQHALPEGVPLKP
jgi:hypothetical protein